MSKNLTRGKCQMTRRVLNPSSCPRVTRNLPGRLKSPQFSPNIYSRQNYPPLPGLNCSIVQKDHSRIHVIMSLNNYLLIDKHGQQLAVIKSHIKTNLYCRSYYYEYTYIFCTYVHYYGQFK